MFFFLFPYVGPSVLCCTTHGDQIEAPLPSPVGGQARPSESHAAGSQGPLSEWCTSCGTKGIRHANCHFIVFSGPWTNVTNVIIMSEKMSKVESSFPMWMKDRKNTMGTFNILL